MKLARTAIITISLTGLGCRQEEKVQLALEQVVMPAESEVQIEDNAIVRPLPDGYQTVSAGKTAGLFPCAIAVARVSTAPGVMSFSGGATLAMQPLNQLMDWTGLWDDTWLISGVVPVTYPVFNDRPVTIGMLLKQARENHAGICLVYSIDEEALAFGTVADMYGEIYDARTEKLLARLHADAYVLAIHEDELPPLPPPDRIDVDHRHIDPWFVVHRRFTDSTRQCVLELIARDERPVAPPDPPRRAQYSPSLQTYPINPQR